MAATKAAGTVVAVHTVHWIAELAYYHNCTGGFFSSLYTHGSISCKALRTLSDCMSSNMGNALTAVAVVASLALSPAAPQRITRTGAPET
jgi:uncharacterized membrane protein